MYFKRRTVVKYFVPALLGAVLYSELFVYLIQPLYWHSLDCPADDITCTKILFVADPQIQGNLAVPPPWNYIFNWDSDRYLRSTFSMAVNYFKPDLLVYMGDLMDEGSISSMQQFHGYVKRLFNIFDVDYPVVQVWIPGDNDIGGENESIKKDKIVEFEKAFYQAPVITYRNISIYKVNVISHNFPQREEDAIFKKLTIVVSHYPVTGNTVFGQQVHKEIRPNIYFCAHTHKSEYVTQNEEFKNRKFHSLSYKDHPLTIHFADAPLYEIYVPTCSYRMGTDKIGYGAAVLSNYDRVMTYSVFWSSTRFPFLIFYLFILLILIVYTLVYCIGHLFTKQVSKRLDSAKRPLLLGA